MVAPPRLTALTIQQSVHKYLDTCRQKTQIGQMSPATHTTYARHLAEFGMLAGGERILDEITGDDIDSVIVEYAGLPDRRGDSNASGLTKSVATQQAFYAALTAFFAQAKRRGWVQDSPMDYAQLKPAARKPETRTARRSLTRDQAVAVLEHGAGPKPPSAASPSRVMAYYRNRTILAFLTVLGPRASEITSADRGDFRESQDGTAVWTVHGKGGKTRRVPISSTLYQRYRQYQESRTGLDGVEPGGAAAFVTVSGGRLDPRSVQRIVHAATVHLAAHSDPDVRSCAREIVPHGLRHTAATLMLASGQSVKVVADLLGHGNIATTSAYLDELDGALAEAIRDHPLLTTP